MCRVWCSGFRVRRDITPIMENNMKQNMDDEMQMT